MAGAALWPATGRWCFYQPPSVLQESNFARNQRLTAIAWLFMIRGVRNTSSSDFASETMSRRKRRPTYGTSPRNGTFSSVLLWVLENTPPITTVSPSLTRTLALTWFFLIGGTLFNTFW